MQTRYAALTMTAHLTGDARALEHAVRKLRHARGDNGDLVIVMVDQGCGAETQRRIDSAFLVLGSAYGMAPAPSMTHTVMAGDLPHEGCDVCDAHAAYERLREVAQPVADAVADENRSPEMYRATLATAAWRLRAALNAEAT